MFKPTPEQIKFAQNIVNTQLPDAAGYRLIIKPLPWSDNLKAGAAAKFDALAKAGFIAQSSDQTAREERGSCMGIVCHAGPQAFLGKSFGTSLFKRVFKFLLKPFGINIKIGWAEEGDIIVFNRYAGLRVDFPPGSEDFYNGCNDEDIICNYGVKV